jgi:capsular polysaccharide biosynthesis protein
MNPEFNLIAVVKSLLKWKWHIAAFTLFAATAAVIMTVFIMKPYYQSFAVVYPVNQSMGDRSALFGNEGVAAEDYYYGSKHDANRIITIATASSLVQYIINEYHLAEHYEYKGKDYEASNTTEEFMENYQVYKTDKDAIRINLIDTDPNLAAKIVNEVVATIANETTRPIEANKKQLAELFAKQALDKKAVVDSLYLTLLSTKAQKDEYDMQRMHYDNVVRDYNENAKLADEYALALKQSMAGIEIIEHAYPAERKLKPVRSKICIATTLIAFILACLGALGMEQVNYIKSELDK